MKSFCRLLMGVFLLLGLVACGGEKGDGTKSPEPVKEKPRVEVPVEKPVPAPAPPPKPQFTPREKAIAELNHLATSVLRMERLNCGRLSYHGVLSYYACDAFQEVIDEGRTRGNRRTMLEAMQSHGYVQLRGRVVALVGEQTYEVTVPRKHSQYRRALLVTKSFGYTTTGGYRLWTRKTGSQMITTTRGNYQDWPIFEENNVGRLYKAMRKAPAGYQTSQAARSLVAELIASVALDKINR